MKANFLMKGMLFCTNKYLRNSINEVCKLNFIKPVL